MKFPGIVAGLVAVLASAASLAQSSGETRLQLNFSVPYVVVAADLEKFTAAQSQARRSVYEIANAECGVLLQAIASECRLDSIAVNTNATVGAPQPVSVSSIGYVNANVIYRVVLKPR